MILVSLSGRIKFEHTVEGATRLRSQSVSCVRKQEKSVRLNARRRAWSCRTTAVRTDRRREKSSGGRSCHRPLYPHPTTFTGCRQALATHKHVSRRRVRHGHEEERRFGPVNEGLLDSSAQRTNTSKIAVTHTVLGFYVRQYPNRCDQPKVTCK